MWISQRPQPLKSSVQPGRAHECNCQVMDTFSELINLLAPSACPGCGTWDTRLCPRCTAIATQTPITTAVNLTGEDVAAVSLGHYVGSLRHLIVAVKHRRGLRLEPWLRESGRTLGQALLEVVHDASHDGSSRFGGGVNGVEVIAMPSRWRRQWSGMTVVPHVRDGMAEVLSAHTPVTVHDAVALRWGSGTQSGVSGRERQRHRIGAMRWIGDDTLAPSPCILVDDVMTTGATLREGARLCQEHGRTVLAVATLAVVARRADRGDDDSAGDVLVG